MKRLLLWLLWLFVMKEFLSYLVQNWNVVSEAPLAFIILFITSLLVSVTLVDLNRKERIEALGERIKARDEDFERIKAKHEEQLESKEKEWQLFIKEKEQEYQTLLKEKERSHQDQIKNIRSEIEAKSKIIQELRNTGEETNEVRKALKADLEIRLKWVVASSKYSHESSESLLLIAKEKTEQLKKIATDIAQETKSNAEGISDYERKIKGDILVLREILINRIEAKGKINLKTNSGNFWDFIPPLTFMGRPSDKPLIIPILEAKIYDFPKSRNDFLKIIEEFEMLSKNLQNR